MSVNAQIIQKGKVEELSFIEKVKPHTELIAAITCGVFTLLFFIINS